MKSTLAYIINTLKRYNYRNLNIRLIIYVCILTILGINVIASATDSSTYEMKQVIGFIVGLIIMMVIALINYNFILKFYWAFYAINIILLLAVEFFGEEKKGATRWIDLGFFELQPSEFTKIFLIIFFAMFFAKYQEKINNLKFLLCSVVLFGIPLALILKQPNLSISIVLSLMFCAIIYIAGLSHKIIRRIAMVAIPVLIILIVLIMLPNQKILEGYQYNRIIGFYDADNEVAAQIRYQQENSVMAIGSGGLLGKGLNNNTVTSVKNANFISEPQTDFIFTIVGEELGFIGTTAVIVLLALISFECFRTGYMAKNLSGRLICCGFGALLAIQTLINLAVATMLIPNTGLTLPFVSYGLSSLVSLFIGIGLVLNVGLQRKLTY